MKIQDGKIELQKKVHRRICVRDVTYLATCPPSYVIFCRFFRVLRFKVEKNTFALKNGGAPPIPSLPPLPALPVSTAVLHKVNLHW